MKRAYSFDDVLIVPNYSDVESRSDCDTRVELSSKMQLDIPVFAANMDTICSTKMAHKMRKLGGCGIIHRYMSHTATHNLIHKWFEETEWDDFEWEEDPALTLAVGTYVNDIRRIDTIIRIINTQRFPINICLDVAHADSRQAVATLDYIRKNATQWEGALIAGNVCTRGGADRLFSAGADIVKVGVGGGSVCTTRIKTGCGYPQLAAIENCADSGPIIADGGIKYYGDAVKALAAGADAVMIGGLLAGTDCTPQWVSTAQTLEFRGMASKAARIGCSGYASNAEGISTAVAARPEGSTQEVVEELMEGIRSAMSYTGSKNLKDFRIRSKFVEVTQSVIKENRPHIEEDDETIRIRSEQNYLL